MSQDLLDWFGQSKIVDLAGDPLPCYHGTPFVFKDFLPGCETPYGGSQGIFFTDSHDVASFYAMSAEDALDTDGPGVHEVYLKIENPLVIEADGEEWWRIPKEFGWTLFIDGEAVYEFVYEIDAQEALCEELYNEPNSSPYISYGPIGKCFYSIDEAFERAIEEGHDGLIVKNVYDTPSGTESFTDPHTVFVVKDSSQIRHVREFKK